MPKTVSFSSEKIMSPMLPKSPSSYFAQPIFVRCLEVYRTLRASVPLPNSRCCNKSRHVASTFNTGSARKETRTFTTCVRR